MTITSQSPSSVVSNAGGWSSPESTYASDDARATVSTTGSAEFVLGGFGFNLGTDIALSSFTCTVEHHESATTTTLTVELLDSTGAAIGSGVGLTTTTTTDTSQTVALTAPTPAQLQAGVQLRVTGAKSGGGGSRTFNIDHVQLTADWVSTIQYKSDSDSGSSGTEGAQLTASSTSSDAGTGVDAGTQDTIDYLVGDDAASSTESTSLAAQISSSETGTGTDVGVAEAALLLQLEVWEAGVLRQVIAMETFTANGVMEATWDASLLADPSGADVELLVVSGGRTFDLDAVAWDAVYLSSAQEELREDDDSGTATETAAVVFAQPSSDSATATEDQVVGVFWLSTDAAYGLDTLSKLDKSFSLTDSGLGLEYESTLKPAKTINRTLVRSPTGRASFDLQ